MTKHIHIHVNKRKLTKDAGLDKNAILMPLRKAISEARRQEMYDDRLDRVADLMEQAERYLGRIG